MIYDFDRNGLIEQGDILRNLPRIPLNNYENWDKYAKVLNSESEIPPPLELIFTPISTKGVLLTQSCDIREGEILVFAELIEKTFNATTSKGKVNDINKIVRDETRFHFFPQDRNHRDLQHPMVIDFRKMFTIPFNVIMSNYDEYFVARLKRPLNDVLKEKISRFFTRLAFEDVYFYEEDEILYLINQGRLSIDDVKRNLKIIGRDISFLDN